ncbi:MAG: hypothetical protein QXR93_07570 [Archaeoglobaceae archaeon]
MIETQKMMSSVPMPIQASIDTDYLKGLLGVDQYKKFLMLAQKLREQIEKKEVNPNEIFEYLTVISDVHIKLSFLEKHQIRTLGRLIGWIHDIAFALSEFYKIKQRFNGRDIESDINIALIELAKLLLRLVNLYEFWLGVLMSQKAFAFDKLTSRTLIQHTYQSQTELTEKKKRWWWF